MICIEQFYKIKRWHPDEDFEDIINAARLCYQSKSLNTLEEKEKFLRTLIKNGHLSPLEHSRLSVIFVTNRGVSHELVRHRLASYSQESTRYCDYSKDRFGDISKYDEHIRYNDGRGNVVFVWDNEINEGDFFAWINQHMSQECDYLDLLDRGYSPQIARGALGQDLKTEIIVTANLREWRHIFKLRCSKNAHPHIRNLLIPLLEEVNAAIPVIFEDVIHEVFV